MMEGRGDQNASQTRMTGVVKAVTPAAKNDGGMIKTSKEKGLQKGTTIIEALESAAKGWEVQKLDAEAVIAALRMILANHKATEGKKTSEDVEPSTLEKIMRMMTAMDGRITKMAEEGKKAQVVAPKAQTGGPRSWSQVAAATHNNGATATVAVHFDGEGATAMSAEDMLAKAKKVLPDAKAVIPNHRVAGKALVVLANHARKEQVLCSGIEQGQGVKLIRRPHQIMVTGVPLSTEVTIGDSLQNQAFLSAVNSANGTQLTRVTWLYNARKLESLRKDPKRARGSIILSTFNQADQTKLVRNGCFHGPTVYEAKLWSPEATRVQCFRCWKWGHTQTACSQKHDTCGHCAGAHATRDCMTKDMTQASCAACKSKGHFAWMTSKCKAFDRFTTIQKEREADLNRATVEVRIQAQVQMAAEPRGDDFTLVEGTKKRKAVGRPRGSTKVATAPGQTRFQFQPPASSAPALFNGIQRSFASSTGTTSPSSGSSSGSGTISL